MICLFLYSLEIGFNSSKKKSVPVEENSFLYEMIPFSSRECHKIFPFVKIAKKNRVVSIQVWRTRFEGFNNAIKYFPSCHYNLFEGAENT